MNADGILSNDRKFQLKFDGSYEVSKGPLTGMNLGLSTRLYSGLPLNAYGYSFAYQNWEYYLAPRGSVGRGPKDWEADLQVRYPIRFGGTSKRLIVQADVFNLSIARPSRSWTSVQPGGKRECAGIPAANCNTITASRQRQQSDAFVRDIRSPCTAANPDYLKKGLGFKATT